MNMEPTTIEQLQAAYNSALEALKASPLFLLKEEAGAALQAAHAAIKAERQAAKIAAHAAKLTYLSATVVDPAF
jgi:cob(I)alamin adenosyltransferase